MRCIQSRNTRRRQRIGVHQEDTKIVLPNLKNKRKKKVNLKADRTSPRFHIVLFALRQKSIRPPKERRPRHPRASFVLFYRYYKYALAAAPAAAPAASP